MSVHLQEPSRVDEPHDAQEYADVITRVASEGNAIVVQRAGADVAVIVPVAYLELLQEAIAREEAERLSKGVDWKKLAQNNPPPQSWFDGDEPKPF